MEEILGTGLHGLVGSRLLKDYADRYHFDNLDVRDPRRPVDITNFQQVLTACQNSPAKVLVHFAAFTDVTAAWQQNGDKTGSCYQVNVEGTKNVLKACQETGKRLIHISTAYVFNGEKTEPYREDDARQPIEWYGQTKAWAEELVEKSEIPWTILRIDQPFRSDGFAKIDTLHRIIQGLQQKTLYPQFRDHYFGPTYINDFVRVIDWVIRKEKTGLYHASSGESWSDYDFAKNVNEILQLSGDVQGSDLAEYLKTLQRPYQKNTALSCDKLKAELDFTLKSVRQAIAETELS
jgi:dTDP-4-dehydrorhamnose reductase